MIFLLMFAGHETTTQSIGQTVIALLERPAAVVLVTARISGERARTPAMAAAAAGTVGTCGI